MNIRKDIPWLIRVQNAMKNKAFNSDDKEQVKLWTTDPISEFYGVAEFKDNDIKRGPKDIYLILDGIFFTKSIEDDDLQLAFACYKSIWVRMLKLHGDNEELKQYSHAVMEWIKNIEKNKEK